MNLLAVSDLHLSAETPERNETFLSFLESAHQRSDEVLLLGDIFDLWLGPEDLTLPFQIPIVNRMRELAQKGLKLWYVEGNRDFYISSHGRSLFQGVYSRGFSRDFHGRRIYAEHGDWINEDDTPYRTFRRLTKNPVARWVVRSLPSTFLLHRAQNLERKMRTTNLKYKIHYPEEYCRKFVEARGTEGADIVIIGHFHEEKTWEAQISSKTVLFYNLPGFEVGFRYLVIPQDPQQRPYFQEEGRSNHGHPAAS